MKSLYKLSVCISVCIWASCGHLAWAADTYVPLYAKEGVSAQKPRAKQNRVSGEGWDLSSLHRRVHPYASLSTTYNDNMYGRGRSGPDKIKDEWIENAGVGVKIDLKKSLPILGGFKTDTSLDVNMLRTYYLHKGLQRFDYSGSLDSKTIIAKFISLTMSDSFSKKAAAESTIDTGGGTDYIDSINNSFNAVLAYQKRRFGAELGFNLAQLYYEANRQAQNSVDRSLTLTALFTPPAMPKTSFLIEGDVGKVVYPKAETDSGDAIYAAAWLGVRGKIAPKVRGSIRVGRQARDYKGEEDTDDLTASVDLTYEASKRTSCNLQISRSGVESLYRNGGLSNALSETVSFSVTHAPARKWSLGSAFSYSSSGYNTGQSSYSYSLAPNISYAFRPWLNMGINYTHASTQSHLAASTKTNTYVFNTTGTF